jgi:hypothetical protein
MMHDECCCCCCCPGQESNLRSYQLCEEDHVRM